jgi:hypothetical protein
MVLVKKKLSGTFFHIHTAAASASSYVEHVQKNATSTPKQTQRNVATTKNNLPLLQTCGNSKTATPT